MCCAQNVGPRCVNRSVDQKSRLVEHLHLAVVQNVTMMIDSKKIALVDAVEIYSERVDPLPTLLVRIGDFSAVAYPIYLQRFLVRWDLGR